MFQRDPEILAKICETQKHPETFRNINCEVVPRDTVTPSGGGDVVVAALGPRVRRWWSRTLLPPWDEWPDPKRWTGLQEKVWQAHVPRKLKLQLKKRQETTAWRSPELCTLTAFPWRMLDCCVCERALPKQFFQYFHSLHHGPSEQPQFPLDFNLSEIRTSTGTYRSMMYGPIGNSAGRGTIWTSPTLPALPRQNTSR